MKNDILIIGAGLGGLFTGAFFAKEGYRVVVLEKNSIIGGGLQCFHRHGVSFDTGMHIMGGFTDDGILSTMCRYLGILDRLTIKHTDDDAMDTITYASDGKTYSIPRGREAFVRYLSQEFPDEAENLERYMDALYSLVDEMPLFSLLPGNGDMMSHTSLFTIPADEFIGRYVHTPRLQDILAYMCPLYGGRKNQTPAYVHALINALFIKGSSLFVGGSQQLADALRWCIEQHGGSIHAGDPVVHISVSDHNVTEVTTKKGLKYKADYYISDIHPCLLYSMLDEGSFTKAYARRLFEIPNSCSAFSVYIKFKPETEPYVNHPRYWQLADNSAWNIGRTTDAEWPSGMMYFTPPTEVEQGPWATHMKINCNMMFDEVRQWEDSSLGHRPEAYKQWKDECMNRILDRMELLYPGFRSHIDFVMASSPLTIRDYYGSREGSNYGFMHDSNNILLSQIPIATKVSNLLLTGQNVNLHGIGGVPLTAIEVVECLIGKDKLIEKLQTFKTTTAEN